MKIKTLPRVKAPSGAIHVFSTESGAKTGKPGCAVYTACGVKVADETEWEDLPPDTRVTCGRCQKIVSSRWGAR